MKKILIILSIIILFGTINKSKAEKEIIIPNESIRFRIISNSDAEYDIATKLKLKAKLEDYLYPKVAEATNINEANQIIKDDLENINYIISEFLQNNNYKIDFGINYFPSKVFKGVIYNGGYYQSLVITLGTGSGSNWWCVLFPPLCLIENNELTTDVEYKLYISRIINEFK